MLFITQTVIGNTEPEKWPAEVEERYRNCFCAIEKSFAVWHSD